MTKLPLSSLRPAFVDRSFPAGFQGDGGIHRRRHGLLLAALLLAAAGSATTARADIWGYVDASGRSHMASEKVDSRYQLFFKGTTRVGAPAGKAETAQVAQAAPSPASIAESKAADNFRHSAQFIRTSSQPNVKRFEPIIEKAAKVHKIDPALVKAVVAVESSFQPDAISPKGARGLMQVIPDTAERYGIVGDAKKSTGQKLLDPATNIKVGIEHLSNLMSMFGSKLELVLAAYNAGEGNVLKYAMKIPPFPETQEYVKLVKQFYAGFKPVPKKQERAVVTQVAAASTQQIKWSAATSTPAVVVPMSMVAEAASPAMAIPVADAVPAATAAAAPATPAVAAPAGTSSATASPAVASPVPQSPTPAATTPAAETAETDIEPVADPTVG